MNIPQGYKQTELGIIPEDWEVKTIGSLGYTYSGLSGKKKSDFGSGNAKYIPFLNILTNTQIDTNNLESVCVSNTEHQNNVEKGDLFFNTSSETSEEVGMCAVLSKDCPNTYLNSFCFGFRPFENNGANGIYLSYFFRGNSGRKLMSVLAQGATRYNLSKTNLLESSIYLPPIVEQRAIAEALSDVDGLIAALDKKIAKKRLLKQGAMQQLLTGKKRLPGFTDEWETIRLGDWATMNSGGTPTSSVPEYYNGHIPFLSISDITEAGKYINKTEKTITEKGLNNSSARMFPAGTIMYAMYASLGKCNIANIELSSSQAILGITPKCRITPEYLYYYLSFIEEDVKDMGQTGTQSNLSKQIVQDFMVKLPSDIKEQQAIATILSDMDKEIADLEAQRDKYRLLKSGMMQKLLTGQIRLVKQQAKIIPLGVEVPAVREIPIDAHIIAGHIVNRSYQSRGWGRTKLQKSLHLIGYCMQLNLGNEYIRNTAGPDDQQLMNYIDQKFRQYRHVNKVCEKLPDGKTHYSYTPTPMIQDVEMAYEKYPKELREQIDALIDKLNIMDLAGAEILSTLYAVWNNRIIKQEHITDDLLIADFYAWSKHKADFEEARVRKALNYMRDNNIIPVGWGKYIDKR